MPRNTKIKKLQKRPRDPNHHEQDTAKARLSEFTVAGTVQDLSSIMNRTEKIRANGSMVERLELAVTNNEKLSNYLVELAAAQKRYVELISSPSFDDVIVASRVSSLLAKWPENAPRAFWEAMKEGDSTEVAMAIVMDPSYGLEKETLWSEFRYIDELTYCRDKLTPLSLAVTAKRLDVVSALLMAGAHPNPPALSMAIQMGDLESFEALITAGATITQDIMGEAAGEGNVGIIKFLAAEGISVKTVGTVPPLHYAARYGHTAAVEAILDLGEDLNVENSTKDSVPLLEAIEGCHIDTVEFLVAKGAQVKWTPSVFEYPVTTDKFEMVKLLLKLAADVNCGRNYISDALRYVRRTEMADLLFKAGAKVELFHFTSDNIPKDIRDYYYRRLCNKY